jgi:hypothetical protein
MPWDTGCWRRQFSGDGDGGFRSSQNSGTIAGIKRGDGGGGRILLERHWEGSRGGSTC